MSYYTSFIFIFLNYSVTKSILICILKPWLQLLKYTDGDWRSETDQEQKQSKSERNPDDITYSQEMSRIASRDQAVGPTRERVYARFRELVLCLVDSSSSRDALVLVNHTEFWSEVVCDR